MPLSTFATFCLFNLNHGPALTLLLVSEQDIVIDYDLMELLIFVKILIPPPLSNPPLRSPEYITYI